MSDFDAPETVAEVRNAFERYEQALVANDVEVMNAVFWDDPRVVRMGIGEQLYGHHEVSAWRAAAAPVPATRTLTRVTITAFGPDLAAVDCEFRNGQDPTTGRQSQLWARLAEGWRIVRAHVSMCAPG